MRELVTISLKHQQKIFVVLFIICYMWRTKLNDLSIHKPDKLPDVSFGHNRLEKMVNGLMFLSLINGFDEGVQARELGGL